MNPSNDKHIHSKKEIETYESPFSFLQWLQNEFTLRCRKNPSYSLRSFAKTLDIDASTLSQILSTKRKLSVKTISKICKKLNVHPQLEKSFLTSASNSGADVSRFYQIEIDVFNVISDWYHFAILEMCGQPHFTVDPKKVASSLDISVTEAKLAIQRLSRVGLIEEKDGQFKKVKKQLTNFKMGETSRAHQTLQKQIINKSLEAIDNCDAEEKDITSIFMSIDEKKIPEAKIKIQKFRRELCQFLEEGEQTRVYNLAVQLFPLEIKKDGT